MHKICRSEQQSTYSTLLRADYWRQNKTKKKQEKKEKHKQELCGWSKPRPRDNPIQEHHWQTQTGIMLLLLFILKVLNIFDQYGVGILV